MTITMPVRQFAIYFEQAATPGLALGWGDEVYTGGLPADAVFPCTCIVPTSGMVKQGNIRYPSMQLSFYHATQGTAAARAEEAYMALKDKTEWTVGTYRILYIHPVQEPFFLQRNSDNVYVYAFNINTEIVAV